MVVERLLKEGQALVRRHDRMISAVDKALKESASYGNKGLTDMKKVNLAVMLENVSNDFDLRVGKTLLEAQGTQVTDIARKNEYLNLISAVMPTLVAEEVVSVQPLKQKAGVVYYMKHVYDSNRGGINQGDLITGMYEDESGLHSSVGPVAEKYNASIDYSSEVIEDEEVTLSESNEFMTAWTPVVPGSLTFIAGGETYKSDAEGKINNHLGQKKGTIDYSTGKVKLDEVLEMTTVSYNQDMYTAPVDVPAIKTVIKDVTVTARPRKLRTGFSLDASFDLQATQNVDLQTILQATATDEIRAEIDGEILRDLCNAGLTAGLQVSWNKPVPFGINKRDHYESFYQTLIEGANKVYQKTRRVVPNIVIVGEKAANVIETMEKFKAAASMNSAGPHIMGTLNNRFTIVKNPYYPVDKFTIVYKGGDFLDTAYVYAPYMPITSTQFLLGANFYGSVGYATSYAKKLVSTDFFCGGTITEIDA